MTVVEWRSVVCETRLSRENRVEKEISHEFDDVRVCMSDRLASFSLRIRLSRLKWIIVAIVNKYYQRNPCDWATFNRIKVYFKFRSIARCLFDVDAIQVINRRQAVDLNSTRVCQVLIFRSNLIQA